MQLAEQTLASSILAQGHFLTLKRDTVVLPNGQQAEREYLEHPGAVAVFAFTAPDTVLLVEQFRYPLHRTFLEVPAGKIDAGETPLATAQRELQEETGYQAASWYALGEAHPCIGYSNERIMYFVAEDLTWVGQNLDEGEFLNVKPYSINTLQQLALQAKISDSKTITGLFWLNAFLSGALARERL